MDKEEKFQQRIMENGWWIRAATKVMKILCIILVVCMLVSTVSSFFFSAVWIFCYDSPGEKSGWVRYILEKGSKGDYNTSLAGLFVSALSAFVYLVMSILAYRFFKHIETQRTPITDSAIAKLRRTGIWIILLQALLLGDSFAMKLLLEYQRK